MRGIVALLLLALLGGGARADEVTRGRYLATVGDCIACHTAPGGAPFAGGRPIATPFGTLRSANITPDRASGIGGWSDAAFDRALRAGIAPGGKYLYPACPFPYFTRARGEDIAAIHAYLRSLAPVGNPVQTDALPFPFDIRALMRGWDAAFFRPGVWHDDPAQDAAWNRGGYLVEGLGHCGACHTAKNAFGADETRRALQGGLLQGWWAPGLTPAPRTGLAGWSIDGLVAYLRTGSGGGQLASGPMAEVVERSTSHLSDTDLRAMAVYLLARPARTEVAVRPAPTPLAGEAIYLDRCAACHGRAGEGTAGLFPALRGSAVVQAPRPQTLIRVVLEGGRAAATDAAPTGAAMPGFASLLDNDEIAAVLAYIRNSWGNASAPPRPAQVERMRGSPG